MEQIGRESQLKVLHGRAHQGIAVAYPNLTARHRVPKPRGKDRRYRIHFGPVAPSANTKRVLRV